MKLDPLSPKSNEKKTDENKSPLQPANNKMSNMMKNWLSKSASKPASGTDAKSDTKSTTASAAAIKNVDSNAHKTHEAKKVVDKEKEEKPAVKKVADKEKEEKVASKEDHKAKTEKKVESKSTKSKIVEEVRETRISPIAESKSKTKKTTVEKMSVEDEEDTPKTKDKKQGSKFYAAYMRREGPKNPGSKRVPIGKKNCFMGLKFLTTGVLESLNRDECKEIIEKYGGSVISGVTKKLDYLIVGEDAGQSKLEKARELDIKQLSEDEFLQLICKKSGITNPKYENDDLECMNLNESAEEEKGKSTKAIKKEEVESIEMDEDDFVKEKPKKLKKLADLEDDDDDTVTPKSKSKPKTPEKSSVKVEKTEKTEKTTPIKKEAVSPAKSMAKPVVEAKPSKCCFFILVGYP